MPLKKAANLDFAGLKAIMFTSIIPAYELDEEGEQLITDEVNWLFNAAEHLQKIILEELSLDQIIPYPVPAEAQTLPQANNKVLIPPNDLRYDESQGIGVMLRGRSKVVAGGWQRDLDSIAKRLTTNLNNLSHYLDREVVLGAAAQSDALLQANIKGSRTQTLMALADLAELMNKVYGILVTGPAELAEF